MHFYISRQILQVFLFSRFSIFILHDQLFFSTNYMQAKKNGENPQEGVDEDQEIEDEEISYLHLEAGGANSIVGRSGITRKSKKKLTKNTMQHL